MILTTFKCIKRIRYCLNFSVVGKKMSTRILREIFEKAVESVQPRTLIQESVKVSGRHLYVENQSFPLTENCYLVGFGKAVLGMAVELEGMLGPHLKRGIVTVPDGIFDNFPHLKSKSTRIKFIEGAKNNIPDERALEGAVEIKNLAQSLSENDLLFVLISGGGSALLPLPKVPITLVEKQDLIKDLAGRGADIVGLNCVRKRLSAVKGGGLAASAYPASLISLILSDIVGDPVDFIASGPTTPNFDLPAAPIDVIKKYLGVEYYERLPISIKTVLENVDHPHSNLIADGEYKHVRNFIVGGNRRAANAARRHAATLGLQSTVISTEISGTVTKIAGIYAQLARNLDAIISNPSAKAKEDLRCFVDEVKEVLVIDQSAIDDLMSFDFSKGVCIIAGGEPTVQVKGEGIGGRNQQLALELSLQLDNKKLLPGGKSADISFLSAGTDGMDGPTDAAGAIATPDLVNNCRDRNIKPEDYADDNDAYTFYAEYEGGTHLVKTGHTGTNVMDVHVLIVKPK